MPIVNLAVPGNPMPPPCSSPTDGITQAHVTSVRRALTACTVSHATRAARDSMAALSMHATADVLMRRVWDLQLGTCLGELSGHAGRVNAAWWSSEGSNAVITASDDNTARVWDCADFCCRCS